MSEGQASLSEEELEIESVNQFWESLRETTHEYQRDELADGKHGEYQQIDGGFVIDEETKAQLESEGYQVEMHVFDKSSTAFREYGWIGNINIRFYPSKPDLNSESIVPVLTELEDKWNRMAEILPDKGKPASPSMTVGSAKFRELFDKK